MSCHLPSAPRASRPIPRAQKRARREAKRALLRARGALMSHFFMCETGQLDHLSWRELDERRATLREEYHAARRRWSAACGLALAEVQ